MPAARGVKRTASKSSTSTSAAAAAAPKNKKKRNVIQLEIPTLPKKRGRVLTAGQGDVGQLGLGEDVIETNKFKQVTGLGEKIVAVCAGGMHTIALDSDGKVWTFGCNDEGALGRPTSGESDEGTPKTVTLPLPAVTVSAGDSHSAALLNNGHVYAWGAFRDSHGSMGLIMRGREGKASREPVRVEIPEPAANIASGGDHLAILTTSGGVYTMGCGEQGQLGRLAQRSASRDTRQGFSALLVPAKVTLKAVVSQIWAGYHATFVVANEKMLAWGLNNYGQLGITGEKRKTALFAPIECDAFSSCNTNWKQVACGQHHSLALDENGQIYAIGRCEYGRLGLGDRAGDAEVLEAVPKLQNKKCVSIAAGTSNSFAVTDTGEIYAWGMGSEGQLGTGDGSDAMEPTLATCVARKEHVASSVSAGGQHTVLLAVDPNARIEASPAPEAETAEEKVEKKKEKDDGEPEEKKPRGRGGGGGRAGRAAAAEQDDDVSSSSSTARSHRTPHHAPQKVNGDGKKATPMEVDETDNKKDTNKDDIKTDKMDQDEHKPETTDTSSQDTVESDSKPDTDVEMTEAKPESTDDQQKPADNQQKTTENQQKPTENQQKTAEIQQKPLEIQQKPTEIQQKATEIQQKATDGQKDEKAEVNGTPEEETKTKTVESLPEELATTA